MRSLTRLLAATAAIFAVTAGPALACGGLIGPNGAVNLVRTTTLAAWHDGYEHYVTSFQFAGGTGEFGSIVPLPGIPTKVERGGDWTLQRLIKETQPPPPESRALSAAGSVSSRAEVLLETRIDALDITVLKGGGAEVGDWAREHGFRLPPDAPEVLDFYASRSPIFMAARFDADAALARGQGVGDGTPIHLTIPLPEPWVPLRILALGKQPNELVQADVYLLTDQRPKLLPNPVSAPASTIRRPGLVLAQSSPASDLLLSDLRSDKGMEWVPSTMWLTYLKVDSSAGQLVYDLATSMTSSKPPSTVAAGVTKPPAPFSQRTGLNSWVIGGVLLLGAAGGLVGVKVLRTP